MIKSPSEVIREIFPGSDLQQIKNNLSLARREEQCRNYPVAGTCFLTLSFAQDIGPVITFRHRLKEHFGIEEMTFSQYLELLHPSWMPFYHSVAEATYKTAIEFPAWPSAPEAYYSIVIPLRKHDGKYYWYRQLSFPALLDASTEMLTAHLNYYHEIGPYEHHRPTPPTVHAKFANPDELSRLQLHFQGKLSVLHGTLTSFLSPNHQEIMRVYADFLKAAGSIPSLEELYSALEAPKSMAAVKRSRSRLAKALREEFGQNSHLANPEIFVQMLRDFFKSP